MSDEPNTPTPEKQFDASDRNAIIVAGGAVALAAGLGIAFMIMSHDKGSTRPPPASQGGLVVETQRLPDEKLDVNRPLRCFVSGQVVGELTLAECAKRNGVATGSLDVARLGDLLARIGGGRIRHATLDRASPFAVPIMMEIGRERAPGHSAAEMILEDASGLIAEAMG